jgi:hypothetical protein
LAQIRSKPFLSAKLPRFFPTARTEHGGRFAIDFNRENEGRRAVHAATTPQARNALLRGADFFAALEKNARGLHFG